MIEKIQGMGMNWVLIVVILIILGFSIFGMAKGIIRIVYKLVAIVLAVLLTILVSPLMKNLIMKTEAVYNFVYEKTSTVVDYTGYAEKADALYEISNDDNKDTTVKSGESALETVEKILVLIGFPKKFREAVLGDESLLAEIEKNADLESSERVAALEDNVYTAITNVVITAISFILSFILIGIALVIIGKVFGLVGKLPVIEGVNAFAGALCGAAFGVVIVWIFFAIITMFGNTAFGQSALSCINDNALLAFIYNHNFISARILH